MQINDKYLINQIDKDLIVLKSALEDLKLSGTSEFIGQYEKKLAEYFGTKFALAVSSGTAALHISLYIAGVRPGDEVIIPAISTLPTAMPLITAGAIPVIVDIEKNGIGLDLNDMKKKLTKKTKAVIQLPLWGYPIDNSELKSFCDENGLILIEDAAQAHGSKFKGKYTGTFGDLGCFSTHDRKILSTGEGGYILTDNEELFKKAQQFSQLGFMNGKDYGVNYKMSALQAALGISRMGQISEQVARRNESAKKIIKGISQTKLGFLNVPNDAVANYYSLVLMLPWDREKNRKFINDITDSGIPSDITSYKYCPIYERELFKQYSTDCPNVTNFIDRMTTVPIRPDFSDEEIEFIVSTYIKKFNEYNKS